MGLTDDLQDDPTEPVAAPNALRSSLTGVANVFSAVGALWIAALMLLIVADVVGRSFLNSPITGVAEVAARSVVAIVFLQIAAAVLAGRMTRADFFVRFLRTKAPPLLILLETLFALTGACVFALILWASWPGTIDAWRTNEFFGVRGVFTIPTLPFRGIIVLGSALAMLAYLLLAAEQILNMRKDRT
ncbi:MAG: TRAP transporter small permease subunit [Paracoccaceae bacterium]